MRRGSAVLAGLVGLALLASPAGAAPPLKTLRGERGVDAVIRTTAYGIPHILARTYAGLGYGYGYAFAKANICTMAETYATVRGERSRYFGPEGSYHFEGNGTVVNNLNSDFFYRHIIGTRTVEGLLAKKAPNGPRPEVRRAVRGYVKGYNRWLRDTKAARIPDATCRGKPWVRRITEADAYRRFYQLALLASSGVAIDGIAAAAPLVPGPGLPGPPGVLPPGLLNLPIGSNAIALGSQGTRSRHGMLLGNPHFPWQGSERFFQAQLTIPGKFDVSGASLFGVPVVLIGHTRSLAWSHTVSTARRFTIFELKLVPGSPTAYVYDGKTRQMRGDNVTVTLADGSRRTRTLYSSHQGPILTSILGLSAFPWSATTAYALGDANAPNFRYLNHFFETDKAKTVRGLDRVLRKNQGIPWVNTIAADSRGEAYYADIGVVPHVTDEQAQRCNTPEGQATFQALRVAVLDGSRSDCEWGRDADAIQPGTFGPSHLPHLFRRDYVTNSNDSYWLSNPKQPLEGFSRIIGDEGTERSLRTRLGLLMVAGKRFTLKQLMRDAQNDRVYSGELFRDDLVRMCEQGPPDVQAACPVLKAWDLKDDLDSRGAVLFRRFATRALAGPGGVLPPPAVFRVPFDRNDPVNTPRGLNTESPAVRQALSDAVQDLRSSGIPLDARLREYQSEQRGSQVIPVPGGPHATGVFNVITAPFAGAKGFPDVNHGSSFVMAAELRPRRCPESRSILTYSQSATDQRSGHMADQTRLFSRKRWVDMRFCPEEILRDRKLRVLQLGCVNVAGFKSVGVAGRSGRLRVRLRRALRVRSTVEVRRGGRRLARFHRGRSFTWKRHLAQGTYRAVFSIRSATGRLDRRSVRFSVSGGMVRARQARRARGCRR